LDRVWGEGGTQFVVVGIETLTGYGVSLDDVGKGMAIGASINRLGPGFGASGGICIIYITGVKSPGELSGYQQGDWDFNLSLGGNWGKMAKGAGPLKKVKPLIDCLVKLGAKTPGGLKQLLKAHPDKWVELIKQTGTNEGCPGHRSQWRAERAHRRSANWRWSGSVGVFRRCEFQRIVGFHRVGAYWREILKY
jgi:hypothetical protein